MFGNVVKYGHSGLIYFFKFLLVNDFVELSGQEYQNSSVPLLKPTCEKNAFQMMKFVNLMIFGTFKSMKSSRIGTTYLLKSKSPFLIRPFFFDLALNELRVMVKFLN